MTSSLRVKNEEIEQFVNNKNADLLTKSRVKIMLVDLSDKIKKSVKDAQLVIGKNVVFDVKVSDNEYYISVTLDDYIYNITYRFNNDKLLNNCIIDNKTIGYVDYNTVNLKTYEFFETIDKKIQTLKHKKGFNIYDKYKIR